MTNITPAKSKRPVPVGGHIGDELKWSAAEDNDQFQTATELIEATEIRGWNTIGGIAIMLIQTPIGLSPYLSDSTAAAVQTVGFLAGLFALFSLLSAQKLTNRAHEFLQNLNKTKKVEVQGEILGVTTGLLDTKPDTSTRP